LVEEGSHGTYHVTDGGHCTWYDFAKVIAKHSNPACKVKPCGSEQYPRPAVRPAYSVLDLGETQAIVGDMPSWETNLGLVLDGIAGLAGSSGSSG
ncbi:MAG: sugar nucleotide-binding protein, partial [Phycisphaeraceae bacterium]